MELKYKGFSDFNRSEISLVRGIYMSAVICWNFLKIKLLASDYDWLVCIGIATLLRATKEMEDFTVNLCEVLESYQSTQRRLSF